MTDRPVGRQMGLAGRPQLLCCAQHATCTCLPSSGITAMPACVSVPCRLSADTQLRKDINSWVAKYRRDDKFSGRPSYG